jgi:uncharacterized BrkB/YihY/UPF0761 family membrane protein
MGSTSAMSKPRPSWFVKALMKTFRILFLTLLMTGLGMGLGLFTGILTTVIGGLFAHHPLDLTRSYKVFAIPSAVIFGGCTLVFQVVQAVREGLQRQNL